MKDALISKPFAEFTPEEFHAHVRSMYEVRQRGSSAKPKSPAVGISLSKTKKGAWSIRLTKTKRAFKYVLTAEIDALAKHHGATVAEIWNVFKAKDFLITKTKLEAEQINADIKEIPW